MRNMLRILEGWMTRESWKYAVCSKAIRGWQACISWRPKAVKRQRRFAKGSLWLLEVMQNISWLACRLRIKKIIICCDFIMGYSDISVTLNTYTHVKRGCKKRNAGDFWSKTKTEICHVTVFVYFTGICREVQILNLHHFLLQIHTNIW